ncbi:MAG TPA: NBR1-Ig-like domain-containing protein [Anaerolineales bacterium]|nr:NBR1-Ig-like domain-containing protein [Anaerolineales bacterium]
MMSMKIQEYVRVLSLVVLLVSFISINQPVRASTSSVDQLDMRIIDRNFPEFHDIIQDQPTVSTAVNPTSVNIGEAARVTVSLNNVPAEGYTSIELTCSYDPNLVEASNIVVASLFGVDPVTAINGPHGGRFVVAIAGSYGNKATNSGTVIVFYVRGLQAGQMALECKARASKGNNVLTEIMSTGANLTILGNIPTPTFQPTLCDKAQFIADINIPDGTVFSPGASFTKTWRLKNVGSCVWTTSYRIVFFSGEQMNAPSSSHLPVNVPPGQTVDISVSMTAPLVAGSYRSYWMFQNASGALFGIGTQANKPWWMDIRVSGPSATPGHPTDSPMPSNTPDGSTLTPSLTPTPTLKPTPCDKAEFSADINVPLGTVMAPGAQFTKTWRLKNVGTCTWTISYRIAFFSGEQMGAPSSLQFPMNVAPGQVVDLSLNLTAPSTAGAHRGYWIFQNDTGQAFGIGSQGNQSWFVDIVVADGTVTPTLTQSPTASPPTATQSPTPSITPGSSTTTPLPGGVYDFVTNACTATWFSATAGELPCPGVEGDPRGFVLKLSNPRLESGAIDTRPGLLMFPQSIQNGYIQGVYPPFHVQSGDRFRSTIGCDGGATSCYVGFRLEYQIGTDPIKTYWGPFLERYDGKSYSIDVDLSPLARKDVKFILTVLSAGTATGDRALWVGPIIDRANAGPTPTVETPSPATPTFIATASDWLTFTNAKYGFRFKYPAQGQIVAGSDDNRTRIDLPVITGTNLREKFLEVVVVENVNRCESPLPSPQSSELITVNGITFLKQIGETRAVGNTYKWTAYSTSRDQACVSFDFVLHSIDPSIFVTPPPILYNEATESAIFGQIVSTYEWFEIIATVTPFVPTPTFTSTPLSATPEFQFGLIIGQVVASKPVHVSLFDATNHQQVASVDANSDGTYVITAPAGIPYTLFAKASGFLSTEGFAIIMADRTTTMPRVSLLAGDLDGNDVIDQFDALTIGMNYNTATPAAADLNNDGIINVLDLELLARNYRSTGPTVWQ